MQAMEKNEFMKGIHKFMTTQIDLHIMSIEEYYGCHLSYHTQGPFTDSKSVCSEIYHRAQTIRVPALAIFERVYELNRLMDMHLSKKPRKQYNECSRPPSIAILNREGNRRVQNAEELSHSLSEIAFILEPNTPKEPAESNPESPKSAMLTESTLRLHSDVGVTYFEGMAFEEQVDFFRKTDILISPHGAQMTGLVYMATDYGENDEEEDIATYHSLHKDQRNKLRSCKQVLEFFPKNYVVPYFFGRTSVQSGMRHSYVYFDDGLDEMGNLTNPLQLKKVMPWEHFVSPSFEERSHDRTANFCIRPGDIISYVEKLIRDWYKCHGCQLADKD